MLEQNVHWLFVIWERFPKSGIIVFLTKVLDKASNEGSDEASEEGHCPRTGCDGDSETVY